MVRRRERGALGRRPDHPVELVVRAAAVVPGPERVPLRRPGHSELRRRDVEPELLEGGDVRPPELRASPAVDGSRGSAKSACCRTSLIRGRRTPSCRRACAASGGSSCVMRWYVSRSRYSSRPGAVVPPVDVLGVGVDDVVHVGRDPLHPLVVVAWPAALDQAAAHQADVVARGRVRRARRAAPGRGRCTPRGSPVRAGRWARFRPRPSGRS